MENITQHQTLETTSVAAVMAASSGGYALAIFKGKAEQAAGKAQEQYGRDKRNIKRKAGKD